MLATTPLQSVRRALAIDLQPLCTNANPPAHQPRPMRTKEHIGKAELLARIRVCLRHYTPSSHTTLRSRWLWQLLHMHAATPLQSVRLALALAVQPRTPKALACTNADPC